MIHISTLKLITTVFVDTRLWKTKHPRKRFQNFRQFRVLSTDRIEIHQLQPLVWPSDLLYVMLAGCDWWISIRSVDNVYDWRKFRKRFRVCFVFQSRVSTKTVVRTSAKMLHQFKWGLLLAFLWAIYHTCDSIFNSTSCNHESYVSTRTWDRGLAFLASPLTKWWLRPNDSYDPMECCFHWGAVKCEMLQRNKPM